MTPPRVVERVLAFIREHESITTQRTVPWSLGTAFFNDDFPDKYDQNFLLLTVDDAGRPAADIAEEADRIQGASGLGHRKIHVPDARIGARLATGFRRLDWNVTRLVIMIHRGPLPEPRGPEVREVSFADLREHWIEMDTTERGFSRDDAEMLVDSLEATSGATGVRLFAGYVEGSVAGWAELYRGGGVGQVENIATFTERRGRGVASAIVATCLREATAGGADLNFLIADDDDWPKELYARLGYEPVAYTYEFLRKPEP